MQESATLLDLLELTDIAEYGLAAGITPLIGWHFYI